MGSPGLQGGWGCEVLRLLDIQVPLGVMMDLGMRAEEGLQSGARDKGELWLVPAGRVLSLADAGRWRPWLGEQRGLPQEIRLQLRRQKASFMAPHG